MCGVPRARDGVRAMSRRRPLLGWPLRFRRLSGCAVWRLCSPLRESRTTRPDAASSARSGRQRRYLGRRQPNVLGRLQSLPRVSLGRALTLPRGTVGLRRKPQTPPLGTFSTAQDSRSSRIYLMELGPPPEGLTAACSRGRVRAARASTPTVHRRAVAAIHRGWARCLSPR